MTPLTASVAGGPNLAGGGASPSCEASQSWADLLRSCRRRGMTAPVLAVGDGALGFWNTVQQALDGGHLPPSADQSRLRTPDGAMLVPHAQQAWGRDPFIGTLDLNQLGLAKSRCALNQSCTGRAEHHPTRRSDR